MQLNEKKFFKVPGKDTGVSTTDFPRKISFSES